MSKEQLLEGAALAHRAYASERMRLREERRKAFLRALSGPVTARELADELGVSVTLVHRIAKGTR